MAESRIFEAEGRAIPVLDEGLGPAIVLLPGTTLGLDDFAALSHSVSAEDFRVLRIGSRASLDETAGFEQLAQDVVDVLDDLGIEDAWIGGHAGGGTVARFVALGHHDRVNGVLLFGVEVGSESDALPEPAAGIPVLVIQGSEDTVTPPANAEALQASAPGLVSVVPIDGAGHLAPVTHVGETSWAIEDYLDWD